MDLFRVVFYDTREYNKYESQDRHEYLCDLEAAWRLWFALTEQGYRHVEIFNMLGMKQEPEKGLHGLTGYNV